MRDIFFRIMLYKSYCRYSGSFLNEESEYNIHFLEIIKNTLKNFRWAKAYRKQHHN